MTIKKTNKLKLLSNNKLLLIITIIGLIIFFIIDKYQQHQNAKQNRLDCYSELNREVSGTVARAFFDDDINVKAFVIYFTNGKKYINPIFEKSLSGYVNEGDSIYKKAGTFKFVIFRKRYDNPVIIVEDTVNCDELK